MKCQEVDQNLGKYQKNLVRVSCLLLTSHKGLCRHFIASCVHVYYAVKYDVGIRNSGKSAARSRGISQYLESGHPDLWFWSFCRSCVYITET